MPNTGTYDIHYDWLDQYAEEHGPDGSSITALVQTDWSITNLQFFQADMLGTHDQAGGKISRIDPERHPSKDWLYCTGCKLARGIGKLEDGYGPYFRAADDSQYGKAVWEITYSWLGYDVKRDDEIANLTELSRYVRKRATHTKEALSLPGGSWKYSSDNKKLNEPTVLLLSVSQLEYTWFWVPHPLNEAVWRSYASRVNQGAFDPNTAGANYATGTVLLQSYQKEEVMDPVGTRCSHVTFSFLVRPNGWNKVYRKDKQGGPGFDDIVANDGSGVTPYLTVDHNLLFQTP